MRIEPAINEKTIGCHGRRRRLFDAFVAYARLLKNDVGEVARFDVRIDWKFVIVDGTVPNLVVTFSRPVVSATVPH